MVLEMQLDCPYFAPRRPIHNAFVESFNGSFRDERLNETRPSSLAEARNKNTPQWESYKCNRPQSKLGKLTPQEFVMISRQGKRL